MFGFCIPRAGNQYKKKKLKLISKPLTSKTFAGQYPSASFRDFSGSTLSYEIVDDPKNFRLEEKCQPDPITVEKYRRSKHSKLKTSYMVYTDQSNVKHAIQFNAKNKNCHGVKGSKNENAVKYIQNYTYNEQTQQWDLLQNQNRILKVIRRPGERHLDSIKREFELYHKYTDPSAKLIFCDVEKGLRNGGHETPLQKAYIEAERFECTLLDIANKKYHSHIGYSDKKAIAQQCLRQLKRLHDDGVLHGDIKSENIGVSKVGGQWHVRFLDFGMSIRLTKGSAIKVRDGVYGTPKFLAPEISDPLKLGLFCASFYSRSSDLYALGVTFQELFKADGLARKHAKLNDCIHKMTAKDNACIQSVTKLVSRTDRVKLREMISQVKPEQQLMDVYNAESNSRLRRAVEGAKDIAEGMLSGKFVSGSSCVRASWEEINEAFHVTSSLSRESVAGSDSETKSDESSPQELCQNCINAIRNVTAEYKRSCFLLKSHGWGGLFQTWIFEWKLSCLSQKTDLTKEAIQDALSQWQNGMYKILIFSCWGSGASKIKPPKKQTQTPEKSQAKESPVEKVRYKNGSRAQYAQAFFDHKFESYFPSSAAAA